MNTLRKDAYLPNTGSNEIILEELEFGFPTEQLNEIQKDWENGAELEQIAFKQKRHRDEVFLAIFHLARKRKITRPFAYRV